MASDLWLRTLERGEVRCRVFARDELLRDVSPTAISQLVCPVRISELGEMAVGEYSGEYRDFVESERAEARYTCAAHKTIEKFGEALQFHEEFIVEFSRELPVDSVTTSWLSRLFGKLSR